MSEEVKETALATQQDVQRRFTLEEIERIGTLIAKSNLFGVKTPEQAIALCLIADAEGQHPALAASEYHIIQNQPSLKAKTLMARFQAAGGTVKWIESTDTRAEAEFTHPAGGVITIDWDMDRAKQAGLHKKDNWLKYPRAMLRARVISEGVPAVFPGASRFYTAEEVRDFDGGFNTEPKNITDQVTVEPPPSDAGKKAADDGKTKVEEARKRAADREKKKKATDKKTGGKKKDTKKKDKPKEEPAPEPQENPLTALDHENQPTGEQLDGETVAKIKGAFAKFDVDADTLENWTKLDASDWTVSVKKDLLKVHALLKAKTITAKDITDHIEARLSE
jgi:hypothetical protein